MVDNQIEHQPTESYAEESDPSQAKSRAYLIGAVVILALLITGIVLAIFAMVKNPVQTETIRDIVIIFMAVESLLIGLILIVLIFQLAKLTALLQNEIRPILESTNDTVNSLKGTTAFLSNNLVRPVIKANSSFSALKQALGVLGLIRPNSTRKNGGRNKNV